MALVAEEPRRFPVVGRMAATLKKSAKGVKGPAQPPSGKNKRKARQEQRISFHKRRRKERRETAEDEDYNRARATMERDMEEARQIQEERQAQIENEPKFDITDIMGNVILAGVPLSMVRAQDDQPLDLESNLEEQGPVKIVMPGSAEALQTQHDHSQSKG